MKKSIFLVLSAILAGCGYTTYWIPGPSGPAGTNGHNSLIDLVTSAAGCSNGGTTVLSGIDADDSGTLELGEVSKSSEICNGADGSDAPPTPYTPVELVNPCGDAPGVYDEIFLKLSNGTIVASFSQNAAGDNTRFSILTAGSYQTTDGDNCVFTLDSSGHITYENHHY